MQTQNIVAGSPVVLSDRPPPTNIREVFKAGVIYRVQSIDIVTKKTILPQEYISAGFIPSAYERHLIKGIGTTNHDLMGSDRHIVVRGIKLSAAWFRLATAEEVNRKARATL